MTGSRALPTRLRAPLRRAAVSLAALTCAAAAAALPPPAAGAPAHRAMRDVLVVGNCYDGHGGPDRRRGRCGGSAGRSSVVPDGSARRGTRRKAAAYPAVIAGARGGERRAGGRALAGRRGRSTSRAATSATSPPSSLADATGCAGGCRPARRAGGPPGASRRTAGGCSRPVAAGDAGCTRSSTATRTRLAGELSRRATSRTCSSLLARTGAELLQREPRRPARAATAPDRGSPPADGRRPAGRCGWCGPTRFGGRRAAVRVRAADGTADGPAALVPQRLHRSSTCCTPGRTVRHGARSRCSSPGRSRCCPADQYPNAAAHHGIAVSRRRAAGVRRRARSPDYVALVPLADRQDAGRMIPVGPAPGEAVDEPRRPPLLRRPTGGRPRACTAGPSVTDGEGDAVSR